MIFIRKRCVVLKTLIFLSIFALGVVAIVLGLTILRADGANSNPVAVLSGIIMAGGGAIGASIVSKKARRVFEWVLEWL